MVALRQYFGMIRMLFATTIIATALSLCGCHSVADWGPPRGFAVEAGDIVAIGRLENLSSEAASYDPNDLLGHGWFSAKFHISQVQSGHLADRVVQVRYFGHTSLREGIRFRFRLRAVEGSDYLICKPPGSSGYNCDP